MTIVKQATPLNSKKRKCEESGKENGKCGPTVKKKKVNCTGKHNTRKNVGRVRIGKSSEFVVELNIRNIIPTDAERQMLGLDGFQFVETVERDLSSTVGQTQNKGVFCIQQSHNHGTVPEASNVAAPIQEPLRKEPNPTQRSRKDTSQPSSAASNDSHADLMKWVQDEFASFKSNLMEEVKQYVDAKITVVLDGIPSIIEKHLIDHKVKQYVDAKIADVLDGIPSIIEKHLIDHKDGTRVNQADAIGTGGRAARVNRV